jgi:hypothetical protein
MDVNKKVGSVAEVEASGAVPMATSVTPVVIVGLGCFVKNLRYGTVVIESQQNIPISPPNNIYNT